MSDIEWSDPAILDLQAIDDYLSRYDIASAERVAAAIEPAAAFFTTMPRKGPTLRRNDARKWLARSTPYLFPLRVLDHGIEGLRVRHGREDRTAD